MKIGKQFRKAKSRSALVPFFEGEHASEKIGNRKIKFEKLENKMERTLAKIAGSSLGIVTGYMAYQYAYNAEQHDYIAHLHGYWLNGISA